MTVKYKTLSLNDKAEVLIEDIDHLDFVNQYYIRSERNVSYDKYVNVDDNLEITAIVGGAVVGLLCAILVVMFIVYRMRKKDEGSYALEEPRRSPATNSYPKVGVHANNREFYA
uniref:Syndecan n=1 Tax=Trichogramma kaykai TaxID=54128 RepID=A0ABD2WCZ7_9HYME